jgi:hypothetical protein
MFTLLSKEKDPRAKQFTGQTAPIFGQHNAQRSSSYPNDYHRAKPVHVPDGHFIDTEFGLYAPTKELRDYAELCADPFAGPAVPVPIGPSPGSTVYRVGGTVTTTTSATTGIGGAIITPSFTSDTNNISYVSSTTYASANLPTAGSQTGQTWGAVLTGAPYTNAQIGGPASSCQSLVNGRCVAFAVRARNASALLTTGGRVWIGQMMGGTAGDMTEAQLNVLKAQNMAVEVDLSSQKWTEFRWQPALWGDYQFSTDSNAAAAIKYYPYSTTYGTTAIQYPLFVWAKAAALATPIMLEIEYGGVIEYTGVPFTGATIPFRAPTLYHTESELSNVRQRIEDIARRASANPGLSPLRRSLLRKITGAPTSYNAV